MLLANDWEDYEIIDASNGQKLERWENYYLLRPDPQIIWENSLDKVWNSWDGWYHRSNKGGGSWEFRKKLPESWTINYKNLTFKVSPTNFKHTGIFPEQAVNWDYVMNKVISGKYLWHKEGLTLNDVFTQKIYINHVTSNMTIVENITSKKPKKILLMLGTNSVATMEVDYFISQYRKLLQV